MFLPLPGITCMLSTVGCPNLCQHWQAEIFLGITALMSHHGNCWAMSKATEQAVLLVTQAKWAFFPWVQWPCSYMIPARGVRLGSGHAAEQGKSYSSSLVRHCCFALGKFAHHYRGHFLFLVSQLFPTNWGHSPWARGRKERGWICEEEAVASPLQAFQRGKPSSRQHHCGSEIKTCLEAYLDTQMSPL